MATETKPVFSTHAGKGATGSIEAVYEQIVKYGCGIDRKSCNWGLDAEKAKVSLLKWAECAEVNSSVDVLGEIVTRIE